MDGLHLTACISILDIIDTALLAVVAYYLVKHARYWMK